MPRYLRKAVITAAGKGTRQFPATQAIQKEMLPLVDRDGLTKPTIQIMIEDALRSGIDQIGLVVAPEDEEVFRRYFHGMDSSMRRRFTDKPWGLEMSDRLEEIGQRLTLIPQTEPEGYGHAVWCAKDFVAGEPFLLMLGDHVYISHWNIPVMREMMEIMDWYEDESVFAVQRTPEDRLHLYGTVAGDKLDKAEGIYQITRIKEKPDVETARAHFRVPGLAEGEYLCFFGMHALTPVIFDCLDELIANDRRERGEFQFTSAQEMLIERAPALALEVHGISLDTGNPRGLLETQIALGLRGPFAEDVRAQLRTQGP